MTYTILALYRKRSTKAAILILLCICAFIHFGSNFYEVPNPIHPAYSELDDIDLSTKLHIVTVDNFYRCRLVWPGSKLGRILFKREEIPIPNAYENRTFVVLVWKHWEWLKNRHVYNFGPTRNNTSNALTDCSVKNCVFSGDDNLIKTADAVLIHLQRGLIPKVENRNLRQRWIFLNDESPSNAFSLSKKSRSLQGLDNVFNWSMTYRSDADVPVPYGRTIPLDAPVLTSLSALNGIASLVPNWENKIRDVPAAVLMSNCGVKPRNDILAKIRQYLRVDVHGACSDKDEYKHSCPGHFTSDCKPISKYLFYLVLENSNCFQYLTEKIFYHAYSKGAIPVIWGPALEDVETLLPPNSYLYVDKKTNIEFLAQEMLALSENDELLLSKHMWRNDFKIVNEHGYFGTKSYHLCRLCEALNYNGEEQSSYSKDDLKRFLDPSRTCK